MLPEKLVIFSSPRSGSKLLADILQQKNYHNFGEFFDTYSTKIIDNLSAVRISPQEQYEIFKSIDSYVFLDIQTHIHSRLISERVRIFEELKYEKPSTVTVFLNNIDIYPELFMMLRDRYFLCLRRKNIFDQIISRMITYHYKNYNGEFESASISANINQFDRFYFHIKKTERIQDFLIAAGHGQLVDFDELIVGTADLGFEYIVSTVDQHTDLSKLITNIDKIKTRFDYLQSIC